MTPIFSEVMRPTEFADLIQPSTMVQRLERMAEQRTPMNMLFYGQPGVGKTTAARILLNKLEVCCYEINGSMETGIEHVRKNIEVYCSSMSLLSAMKLCFIDECEYLSINAQASLRGLIEKYDHVRFLLTANDIKKMHPALRSRCLPICFDVGPIEAPEVIARLMPRYQEKLRQLGCEIDAQRLHEILCTSFPDLRAVANRLEFEATPLPVRIESALGSREADGREQAA
jgi:replication-associated recombination protein RarA